MEQWWHELCKLMAEVAQQQQGPQLLAVPVVLLITVHCGYSRLKYKGYRPLHALYLALVALAVFLSPLALLAVADNLEAIRLPQTAADLRVEQLYAAGRQACRMLAALAPLAGLWITYRLVLRTLRCQTQEAYQFMLGWTMGNLVLGFLLVLSIPNYIAG